MEYVSSEKVGTLEKSRTFLLAVEIFNFKEKILAVSANQRISANQRNRTNFTASRS
jgi:hypothetical protein